MVHAAPPGMDRGGVSSSAALSVALLMALQQANGIDPRFDVDQWETVLLGQRVENGYLGLRTGVLDQATVALSRRTALTLIDCKSGRYAHEPFGCDARSDGEEEDGSGDEVGSNGEWEDRELPFVVLLAFSGLREALTATGYNQRVDECRSAAALLRKMTAGEGGDQSELTAAPTREEREAGPFVLSDVTREAFEAHVDRLPSTERKRATHYFDETARVAAGVTAWRRGDLAAFGRLVSASGTSSIDNYECGCAPMNDLRAIAVATPGVLGARFSGAGFRGCVVALVEPGRAVEAAAAIEAQYAAAHSNLVRDGRAGVFITRMAAGARCV